MFEGLLTAFGDLAAPWPLLLIFAGTALGLMVGALPGLSSPMAIIVLLPITYQMETLGAFQLMVATAT